MKNSSLDALRRAAVAAGVVVVSLGGAFAAEWSVPDQTKAPVATRPWKVVKDAAPSLIPGGQWKLVWHDEFDGDRLDTSKWGYRTNFWGISAHWFARPEDGAVEVTNGVARLKLVRRADGQIVSPQLQTGSLVWDDLGRNPRRNSVWPFPKREQAKFQHRFGYYECRCRLQRRKGWWSAFWMQAAGSGATLDPRQCGVEHDIMESFFPGEVISHAFIMRGYGADCQTFTSHRVPADVNLKENPVWRLDPDEFHTFGFLWEEDGYTVFVDGRRSGMKVGSGPGEDVSQVPEFILVSTECKMFRANRGTGKQDPDLEAALAAGDDFVIDHVRVFDRVDVPGAEYARGEFHARDLTPLKGEKRQSGSICAVRTDKVPLLSIVVNDRNRLNVMAAEYLQTIIGEMTGAKPIIWRETEKKPAIAAPAFYVGDDLEMVRREQDLPAADAENDGFAVAVRHGSYFFLGRAHLAVYDFCERVLGSREFFDAAEGGRSVLRTKGLTLPIVEWSDRPVFLKRQSYPYHHLPWCRSQKDGAAPHRPASLAVHSSINAAYLTNHNWKAEAPDVFMLDVDGNRVWGELCYGNPKTLELYKEAVDIAIAENAKGSRQNFVNPTTKSVTLSQADGSVTCHCEHCNRLRRPDLAPSGDGSPIIWSFFAKNLAGWLKERHPGWHLVILPYVNTCDVPPGLDLTAEGNVEAMLCTMPGLAMLKNPETKKHEEDLIRAWHKVTGNRVINWHYSCWPAEFTSSPFLYGEQIRSHYRGLTNELAGTYINGPATPLNRHALNLLVWMRCLWNPEIDVNGVYDGFANRMFGEAAKPMRRIIRLQQEGWNRPWRSNNCSNKNVFEIAYPTNTVAEMKALFAEAHALAKGQEETERRIAWYEKGFESFFKESGEYASGNAFAPLIMKKTEQPKIDGKLDDPCWKLAEGLKMVRSRDLKDPQPTYPTEVKAVWNEKGVTFGFTCWEKRMDLVQTKAAPGSFANETFDIFLDASGGGEGMYAQFILDARNTVTRHEYGRDFQGETGIRSGFDIDPKKDHWTAELYVPYAYFAKYPNAQIPTTTSGGRFWTGNISRWRIGAAGLPKAERPAGEAVEMQRLWTRGNWWNSDPGAFGVMKFVE